MKKLQLSVSPKAEMETENFEISIPETVKEFHEVWGNPLGLIRCSSSVIVQAQAAYRVLRNRKNEPLTAKKAAEHMLGWKPNVTPDTRKGLTKTEKLVRDAEKAGFTKEQIAAMLAAIGPTDGDTSKEG